MSFPGRRIAVLIDASASMMVPFKAASLTPNAPERRELLHRHGGGGDVHPPRMKGKYRDLIALIEFGDEVVRHDAVHQRLRQHPAQPVADRRSGTECRRFPIGHDHREGPQEAVELFRAFDFLDAAGNLI